MYLSRLIKAIMSTIKYSEKSKGFFKDVWDVVVLIPEGRVTSYGAIARYLGSGGSSRMVGWAMNACHANSEPVPAQRVLNRNGMLTGKNHFDDPTQMQRLLEAEGVDVENDKVVRWKELFWDPSEELSV